MAECFSSLAWPGLVITCHVVTCPLSGSLSITGRQRERESAAVRFVTREAETLESPHCPNTVTPRALQSLHQAEHAGHLLYALQADIGH